MISILCSWLSQERTWVVLLCFILPGLMFSLLLVTACSTSRGDAAHPGRQESQADAPAVRGKYLVTALGCNDCHTPHKMGANGLEPDMARMLSGHPHSVKVEKALDLPESPWGWYGSETNTAFSGPWGVSFAANLTPDDSTGIGIWTEEIFIQTLRSGKHWGQSRPILPPMPWFNFAELTEDDLRAIFLYLRTIPPVPNSVQEPLPPPGRQDGEAE